MHMIASPTEFKERKNMATAKTLSSHRVLIAIVLLCLCSLAYFAHRAGVKSQRTTQLVYGKTFSGVTVELDGKRFDHCKFDSVRFVYEGTGPVEIVNSDFATGEGKQMTLHSDNDEIKTYLGLMAMLQNLSNAGGRVSIDNVPITK
jgi:hypothetical protein